MQLHKNPCKSTSRFIDSIQEISSHFLQLSVERTEDWGSRPYLTIVRQKDQTKKGGKSTFFDFEEKGNMLKKLEKFPFQRFRD